MQVVFQDISTAFTGHRRMPYSVHSVTKCPYKIATQISMVSLCISAGFILLKSTVCPELIKALTKSRGAE